MAKDYGPYSGGSTATATSTNQGPAGGASAGGDYGGDSSGGYTDRERGATYASYNAGQDIDDTYSAADAYFEPTYEKTFVDKVIDYYKGGGLLVVIAGNLGKPKNQYEGLVGETDYGAGGLLGGLLL